MLIQEYTSEWKEYFQSIKKELENAVTGITIKIEHVGSTSVSGLASKPIIDIDIIYNKDSDFKKIKTGLASIGYYHNGNQGILHREVFKRNGTVQNKILDSIPHHLYACPIHSDELDKHLLFRDHLRKNKTARLTYQNLKYTIAERADQNRKAYNLIKEIKAKEFICSIIDLEKKMLDTKK
ncbi:GrpB family protein [Aquimarina sp. M1]